ncbi:MAG: hypothetical protein AAF654_12620 [Myxococcota bacterium]
MAISIFIGSREACAPTGSIDQVLVARTTKPGIALPVNPIGERLLFVVKGDGLFKCAALWGCTRATRDGPDLIGQRVESRILG